MKKYSNILVKTGLIILLFFVIKSRRVPESTFNLLVRIEINEVYGVCMGQNQSAENYNLLIKKYGFNPCENTWLFKKKVEESYKDRLHKQWRFIY